jgi:hypothetical protein
MMVKVSKTLDLATGKEGERITEEVIKLNK